ncbi:MAG: N-acetylmuramic acid 6-phosphate etherase [Treponema sp.]|nr:N-acetylmuramic acid 6-phosphate etherase [Treponema sp.]
MIDLTRLTTETRNENTMSLDIMTPLEIAQTMNREDRFVAEAVSAVLPEVAIAISWCTEALKNGARIIYMGAGTSGRLGLLDAVECPPTFGVSPEIVVGLIAGGHKAFVKAVEGAEDSHTLGRSDLEAIHVSRRDVVIGLAASGRTPYVIYALRYARSLGCKTVAIACNKNSLIGKEAELAIEPVTGPEVLAGSTRLKSGTAQKMILNMISTGSMIGIGKVYENMMVDLMQTNEKLATRAENIVMTATKCSRPDARHMLDKAGGSVKTAIAAILFNCGVEQARQILQKNGGHVRSMFAAT